MSTGRLVPMTRLIPTLALLLLATACADDEMIGGQCNGTAADVCDWLFGDPSQPQCDNLAVYTNDCAGTLEARACDGCDLRLAWDCAYDLYYEPTTDEVCDDRAACLDMYCPAVQQ